MHSDKNIIWDEKISYPEIIDIPIISNVEYILVQQRESGYKFLHEPRIAFHKGTLFISFSNATETEADETQIIRGRRSEDLGKSWSETEIIAPGSNFGERHETCPMLSIDGTLWAFVGRFGGGKNYNRNSLGMELYYLDEESNSFKPYSKDLVLPNFIPFVGPQLLENGNYIIGGHADKVTTSAVAISSGNDITKWKKVNIETPEDVDYPETALLIDKNIVVTVTRNRPMAERKNTELKYALTAYSNDSGKSFTPLIESNLPMANSKPFCGKLSNGQNYIIYNACQTTPINSRNALLIAVTNPNEILPFRKVWKIIEGTPESISKLMEEIGSERNDHSWAYPEAVEKDGTLYVTFSNDGKHCWLAKISIENLKI